MNIIYTSLRSPFEKDPSSISLYLSIPSTKNEQTRFPLDESFEFLSARMRDRPSRSHPNDVHPNTGNRLSSE